MTMRRANLLLLLPLSVCFLPARSPAQAARAGLEFQVNTYTYDFQIYPSAAADDGGNFVIVWSSYFQDYYYGGVFAQRFDARGERAGTEFKVNTYVFDDQYFPDVSKAPNGRFVVVWASYYQDADDFGIFGQRFGSDGAPEGSEFMINTYTVDYQGGPAVDHDGNGNFVVAWADETQDGDDFGIFAQRFGSDGAPRGTEFQVNTYTTDYQGDPRVAMRRNGDFVVIWTSNEQDHSAYGVFAQHFASSGVRVGTEMQVNTYTIADQHAAVVAASGDGFVVAWQSVGQDGVVEGIFARRLGASGFAGAEFQVNTFTPDEQSFPSIGADRNGNFTITWASDTQDGDQFGVFATQFASDGSRIGSEFLVNTETIDAQTYPGIAVDPDGNYVVVWSSFAQDGEFSGIFAQRFSSGEEPETCPGDCNGDATVTVDELVRGVNIALGAQPLANCPVFDRNGSGSVEINELVQAVNAALNGCP